MYFQDLADHENPTNLFRASFRSENALERWITCCEAAVKCCETMALNSPLVNNEGFAEETEITRSNARNYSHSETTCPWVWDGWTCWRAAEGGRLAISKCPNYIYFDSEPPTCPSMKFFSKYSSLNYKIILW